MAASALFLAAILAVGAADALNAPDVPVIHGARNLHLRSSDLESCFPYQVTRLHHLTPFPLQPRFLGRRIGREGTTRSLQLRCRSAVAPHSAVTRDMCLSNFGNTERTVRFAGRVVDDGKGISVDFRKRVTRERAEGVERDGDYEDDGPVFLVCDGQSALQCEVFCLDCGDLLEGLDEDEDRDGDEKDGDEKDGDEKDGDDDDNEDDNDDDDDNDGEKNGEKESGAARGKPGEVSLGVFRVTPLGFLQPPTGSENRKTWQSFSSELGSKVAMPMMVRLTTEHEAATLKFIHGEETLATAWVRLVWFSEVYRKWAKKGLSVMLGLRPGDMIDGRSPDVHGILKMIFKHVPTASDLPGMIAQMRGTEMFEEKPIFLRNTFEKHGTCPMTFSHRGVSARGTVSENSLIALVDSALEGYDGAEFDVFLAGSDEVGWTATVLHDLNLDRLTGIDMKVSGWSPEEAEKFDGIRMSFAPCYMFPTLEELLIVARLFDLNLDLELKPESPLQKVAKGYAARLGREVGRIVRATGMADRVVVTGFDPTKLRRVNAKHEKDPIQVGLALHGSAESQVLHTISNALRLHGGAPSRIYQIGKETKGRVARTHRRGGYAGLYTFGDLLEDRRTKKGAKFFAKSTVSRAVEMGVDWIEADDMKLLQDALAETKCKSVVGASTLAKSRRQIAHYFSYNDHSSMFWGIDDEFRHDDYKIHPSTVASRDNKRSRASTAA